MDGTFYQPQVVVPMQFVPSPMYIPYGNTNFFPTFTCVQNYQQMVQEAGAIHMRKLFIGGISHETTDDDLRNYYGQWGDVVDCIVIRDPNTKCSRGFGFVTFATFLMAEAALASKPHFINGKLVDSKPAIPREQMTANFYNNRLPILGVTESEPGCKIFLSGLDFASLGYSVDPLRQHFGVYGTVEQVEVLNIKGTGFIIYEQKSQADECLAAGRIHQINGHEFGVTRDLTFVDKEYSKTNENQLSPGNSVSETDFNGGGCVTIETTAKSSSVSTEYELDSPQQISNSKPKLGGEYSPKVRNVNGVEYHRHNCRMNSESKTILNGFKTNKAMKKRKQEKN